MSLLATILLISSLAIGIIGGSSSGGGGSNSSGESNIVTEPDDISNNGWNNTVDDNIRGNYDNSEISGISDSFYQINLLNSYAILEKNSKNVAGDGIDVAVIDTGINLNHIEFSGDKIRNFSDTASRNYVGENNNITDDNGHGSHVAGIIGANRGDATSMHGVAFNSRLVGYKAINNLGSGSSSDISSAIEQSVSDQVSIINLSLGSNEQPNDIKLSLIEAKNNNILTIAASGNCRGISNDDPSCSGYDTNNPVYPANYATDSEIIGSLIAVGSVHSSNNLSHFSHYCGDAANYCLVAPGENIWAPNENSATSYEHKSGTSMAAPMVSGVAAILRSAWPHLTAEDTAQIILTTATDLGDAGIDSNYGNGLLNAEAAVNNIGSSYVASSNSINSAGYYLEDSNISSSSIFGDTLTANIIPKISDAVFFDDFNRDYKINFSDIVQIYNHNSPLKNMVFNDYHIANMPFSNQDFTFNLKFTDQKKSYDIDGNITGQNYFNIKNFIHDHSITDPYKLDNRNLSFIYQSNLSKNNILVIANNDYLNQLDNKFTTNYGLVNHNSSFSEILSNNINKNNKGLRFSQKITDKIHSKFGFSQISDDYSMSNSNIMANILQLGFDYRSNLINFDINYGQIEEYQNNFLGGKATGLFSNLKNNKSNFVTVKNKYQIKDNLYFISSYSEGLTTMSGNKNGIFRDYSDIKSRAYEIGIFNDNFMGGKLAINYSEPLRIYDAKTNINIPIGYDNNGDIARLKINDVNLEPLGHEKNVEISYQLSKENQNLNLNFLAIEEGGNIKDQKDEYIIFLKYNRFW
jgi:subtilisin family serine protease